VVVVREVGANMPRLADARIEQPDVTHMVGWNRRTVKRLRPQ
jgi:hypothetical protein